MKHFLPRFIAVTLITVLVGDPTTSAGIFIFLHPETDVSAAIYPAANISCFQEAALASVSAWVRQRLITNPTVKGIRKIGSHMALTASSSRPDKDKDTGRAAMMKTRLIDRYSVLSKMSWETFKLALARITARWGMSLMMIATWAALRSMVPYQPNLPSIELAAQTLHYLVPAFLIGCVTVFPMLIAGHRWVGVADPEDDAKRLRDRKAILGAAASDFILLAFGVPFVIAGLMVGYPWDHSPLIYPPVLLAMFRGWSTLLVLGLYVWIGPHIHLWQLHFGDSTGHYATALILYRLGAYISDKTRRVLYPVLDFFLAGPPQQITYRKRKKKENLQVFIEKLLEHAEKPYTPDAQELAKEPVTTEVIADVHLGARDANPEKTLALLNRYRPKKLIIDGDLIDAWNLFKSWYFPEEHYQVLFKIIDLAKQGTEVVITPGNHDDFMRYHPLVRHYVQMINDTVQRTTAGRAAPLQLEMSTVHRTFDQQGNPMDIRTWHGDDVDKSMKWYRWGIVGTWARDIDLEYVKTYGQIAKFFGIPRFSLSRAIDDQLSGEELLRQYETAAVRAASQEGYSAALVGHSHVRSLKKVGATWLLNSGKDSALIEFPDHRWQIVDGDEETTSRSPRMWLQDPASPQQPVGLMTFESDNAYLSLDSPELFDLPGTVRWQRWRQNFLYALKKNPEIIEKANRHARAFFNNNHSQRIRAAA